MTLTKLAQDITKCAVTLKEIGYKHDLETQAALDTIVDRLPSYMRTKWVDKANEKKKGRMNVQALTRFANSSQIELGLCALVMASIILKS